MTSKTLIKSTSGIRGVIGRGFEPQVAINYAAAFGTLLKKGKVIVGRDSRPSGEMITRAVVSGLVSVGIDVIEIGVVPTPTVEIAIKKLKASGGVCVTASHNPAEWNALKFFNDRGELITPSQYKRLDKICKSGHFAFKPHSKLGKTQSQSQWINEHVRRVLSVKTVNKAAIRRRKFTVVVDAINGAGSVALPLLLKKLGAKVFEINCKADGQFVHEPEPVPKNLGQLGRAVKRRKADLGLACDPDADRLALVDERGRPIGEELTLTIAVKEVLKKTKGATVINLSTSKVTADVARSHGSKVYYSRVGESNVVQMIRARRAVIGGEGNGGVIYPAFHTGRDALIAAALVLSCLAEDKMSLAQLVETLPKYYIIKSKAALPDNFSARLGRFEKKASRLLGKTAVDKRDGLRFDFQQGWVQIRPSNTEPIFRLIVETSEQKLTRRLSQEVMEYFT
ncbi:MAG: phosphoglucosamine mutase [Candidatus Zixiibacteriota bacterium]|nr:MAG: phosphoglucosamine mutase [candidate division Zixibacteria bacterium]